MRITLWHCRIVEPLVCDWICCFFGNVETAVVKTGSLRTGIFFCNMSKDRGIVIYDKITVILGEDSRFACFWIIHRNEILSFTFISMYDRKAQFRTSGKIWFRPVIVKKIL